MPNRSQARVANAPDYRLIVDGQIITPRVRSVLISLTLTDNRGGEADALDITLADDDATLAIPPKGATISLALGWQATGLVDRGTYIVDEVEHSGTPDVLAIRARSANMRNTLPDRRTVSWHGITLGDIIDTIAGRHQLAPAIAARLARIAIEHIDQTDESDLNFLTRIGQRYDAVAAVKTGRLLFTPAGAGQTVSGLAIPGIIFTREDGDSHRYTDADRNSVTGVIAHWRDLKAASKQQVIAGNADQAKTLREIYTHAADAQAAAASEWQRLQRGEKSLSLTIARGRPDIYPETPASVRGYKPDITATPWLITKVTHSLGSNGYRNQIELEVLGSSPPAIASDNAAEPPQP